MKIDKQTKDDAANYVFAKRIQTSLDIKYTEPYHSSDPFMTAEQHEHGLNRLARQQKLLDYIYNLILKDIENDNKSN